jgi:C4-dicarboxylate-specific signal transduction histidine kinase
MGGLMSAILDKLPSILVLAVLVGIFISIRKHSPTPRIHLWILAWTLVLVHFFVQVFEVHTGLVEGIIESIDIGALEIAGAIFAISVSTTVEDTRLRRILTFLIVVPVAFHAVGATLGWHANWILATDLGLLYFVAITFQVFAYRKTSLFHLCISLVLAAAGIWSVNAQFHGDADPGLTCILTLGYGVAGVLYWQGCKRFSTGAIAIIGGFLSWGAVFPIGMALDHFYPHLAINSELWNVPKFFVAFGMILSLLEEKSRINEENMARERSENAMLERFSHATSRLLTAHNPLDVCAEIAEAIHSASSFRLVAVLLASNDATVSVAGSSGLTPLEAEGLTRQASQWTARQFLEFCCNGSPLAHNSFLVPPTGLLPARAMFFLTDPAGASLAPMAEVIVPLSPARGAAMGWILLCAPEVSLQSNSSEITKVEMLAADLAVSLENARLHNQLVRSEKLASLGQLVAGVAHEMNNPLAAVIGYNELLIDEAQTENIRTRLGKVGNEARRIKRIIEGLLRFARQNHSASHSSNFEAAFRDAIMLREYDLRTRGIQIQTEIAPTFPSLAIREDDLKQVLLNLLNNSVDAVQDRVEKIIQIRAALHDGKAGIEIEDSGPGFADLNRAFDPFYTTKPVGSGTGLGLSICYGIVNECGGRIQISNKEPSGAVVSIELPVAAVATLSASMPSLA